MTRITRRALLGGALAAPAFIQASAHAQPSTVRLALLTPLSGPFARQGELERLGAVLAVEDINRQGGIKALGGARLELSIADAGANVEQVTAAAQRLVADRGLVAGLGAWASSFTLAATEVTERARLPWITLSWADSITERGFHYVIATSPPSSSIIPAALRLLLAMAERAAGKKPATIACINDDTAVNQANMKPLREGGFARLGLNTVMDENFSVPLSDAAPLIQRLRRSRPDLVLLGTTATSDSRLLLQTLTEFGLGQGKVPVIAPSANWGTPEMLRNMGATYLEGVIGVAGNWTSKQQAALNQTLLQRAGEPWLIQDTLSNYGHVLLVADALERAGRADRDALMQALLATDTTEGPAKLFLGERLRFEPNGRRANPVPAVYQWKNGRPLTVLPEADAEAELSWPRPG
ncbi:ABC transporter substrate-binding protein [Pseudoroseomonas cervicalis]|uniref:ABC transporter substrate-binding protein n=1 Tax=Teichococcus cervicalis TaxID=204525 RepID=UPI0035EB5AA1